MNANTCTRWQSFLTFARSLCERSRVTAFTPDSAAFALPLIRTEHVAMVPVKGCGFPGVTFCSKTTRALQTLCLSVSQCIYFLYVFALTAVLRLKPYVSTGDHTTSLVAFRNRKTTHCNFYPKNYKVVKWPL